MYKKSKIILVILMTILIIPLSIGQEINDQDLKIWNSLSAAEKWESYKIAHNSYIRLKIEKEKLLQNIETEQQLSEQKNILIEEYQKLLKQDNKFGFGLNIYAGMTEEIKFESYISSDFYFHFFNNHFSIVPGFYIKTYDKIGGGLKFGLVFSF